MKSVEIKFKEDYIIETTYDYSPIRKNTYTKTKVEKFDERKLSQLRREKSKKLREEQPDKYSFGREPSLTREESRGKITREYKKLFDKGSYFKLKKGVNVFVGDNGCGKSTFIKLLLKENPNTNAVHIDLEKVNPNISTPGPEKGLTYSAQEISNQFMWSIESHGETREGVLKSILSLDLSKYDLLIMDEPEQGLSLKNQAKYFKALESLEIDVILITHSKVFIELSEYLYDIEKMSWIDSKSYLKEIF